MSLYWKDITTPDNKWRGIEITVEKSHIQKINFHIESCSKRFFTINYENKTLLWARQHCLGYGVALIKNLQRKQETPIISHIHSSDIEERKELQGSEKFKSWSKYFIQSLNRIDNHFFTHGKWLITVFASSNWDYYGTEERNKSSFHKEIFNALKNNTFQYISWVYTPNDKDMLFTSLNIIDEHDGRLKWWRKKAKEKTLPPILVYFVSGLDSYIILDGHYRLKAAQLENIEPDIILLSNYETEKYTIDTKIQTKVLKSLENRNNKRNSKPLKQDALNKIFIDAYKKEYIDVRHVSKSIQVSTEICLQDMISYLDKTNQIVLAQRFFDETDEKGW